MGMKIFLYLCNLFIPALMLFFGITFKKHPPGKVNMAYGAFHEKSGNLGICPRILRNDMEKGRGDHAGIDDGRFPDRIFHGCRWFRDVKHRTEHVADRSADRLYLSG